MERARKAKETSKAKGKKGEGEEGRDEKKGRGKFKEKAKATEFCAGCCLGYKAWGHMTKDFWLNDTNKMRKDAASLESASTGANVVAVRRQEHKG